MITKHIAVSVKCCFCFYAGHIWTSLVYFSRFPTFLSGVAYPVNIEKILLADDGCLLELWIIVLLNNGLAGFQHPVSSFYYADCPRCQHSSRDFKLCVRSSLLPRYLLLFWMHDLPSGEEVSTHQDIKGEADWDVVPDADLCTRLLVPKIRLEPWPRSNGPMDKDSAILHRQNDVVTLHQLDRFCLCN